MGGFSWVTLATNDSYSLGALVLAHSLRRVGTIHQLTVMVTPGVTQPMREKLQTVFNLVFEVNILDSKDERNLLLLQRPELGITFTKLHCWRLTQFDKCVFLDADTLVLRNSDELFERDEFSAAPDVGWPDCFNSGVFVYKPSEETFNSLLKFALEKGSFDGGDQGLLNLYFSDWSYKDIRKHLPFIYNMCSTACYSYLPAFKQFGENVKIIHFIGNSKPWLQHFNSENLQVTSNPGFEHLRVVFQLWWDLFCSDVHSNLSSTMGGLAGAFAQMTLREPRSANQGALEEHIRRQGWEAGRIDYLGQDSFDNIWKKICLTMSSAPKKESTPPKEMSKPVTATDIKVIETPATPQELSASKQSTPVIETAPVVAPLAEQPPAAAPVSETQTSPAVAPIVKEKSSESPAAAVPLTSAAPQPLPVVDPVIETLPPTVQKVAEAVLAEVKSSTPTETQPTPPTAEVKSPLPVVEQKSAVPVTATPAEVKPLPPVSEVKPATPTEVKAQPPVTEAKPVTPAEVKPQLPVTEIKSETPTEVKPQPPVTEAKPVAPAEVKPQPPASDVQAKAPVPQSPTTGPTEVKSSSPKGKSKNKNKSANASPPAEVKPPAPVPEKKLETPVEVKPQTPPVEQKPKTPTVVPTAEVKPQTPPVEEKPKTPAEVKPQTPPVEEKPQTPVEVKPTESADAQPRAAPKEGTTPPVPDVSKAPPSSAAKPEGAAKKESPKLEAKIASDAKGDTKEQKPGKGASSTKTEQSKPKPSEPTPVPPPRKSGKNGGSNKKSPKKK